MEDNCIPIPASPFKLLPYICNGVYEENHTHNVIQLEKGMF